ncbi:hypothetical protein PIIN_10128 [Serendipita indica DSM 11827]|uniref:Uncharacterized protein n=1 Tax=Serendipita indica (strain DSM 11827) TaxID=1109443 RepID=G4TXT5_SERID|nr:hypothetical protein PIIN_10128 [Serendipita indica DSM 11827]
MFSFVAGSMAKGRGGGGGGASGSIDDGWDVPGIVKAAMAFRIIWSVVIFGLFLTILRRLRSVPPGRYTRAPYILLSIVAGTLSISYLLSAILFRMSTGESNAPFPVIRRLGSFNSFLSNVDIAFEPAVSLWLVHLRGRLTNTAEAKSVNPWVSQHWKRIVDWSLVAITFTIGISTIAISENAWALYEAHRLDSNQLIDRLLVNRNLNLTVIALGLFLAIDIAISFISLKISQKRVHFIDPLTTRLLRVVLPFVVIGFIQSLVITILPNVHTLYETEFNVFNLVITIIDGICRIVIIGGLLSTMVIPNVLWIPGATTSAVPLPVSGDTGYMSYKS